MSPKTQKVLDEIKAAVAAGQDKIVPAIFSHCYGRAATSAAFRIAKKEGIIVINYMSCVNTPVYCGPNYKEHSALLENCSTAVAH